jgi:pimeloyl-ACP methyl ester carboxylesterase
VEASRQKSQQASHFLIRIAPFGFAAFLLFGGAACATCSEPSPPSLSAQVRNADAAYQSLPASLAAYNLTVRELCGAMEVQKPSQFASNLKKLGVSFDSPKVGLPLRHVEVPTSPSMASAADAGIPVVAGYDTREAPLYPPEGLFVDATAIYDRVAGRPRFSLRYRASKVTLNGRTYKLAADPTGAGDHLKLRAKRLAKSGFAGMIRPSSMPRKPQIYLLDPYDPNKTPLLMVHGLQSTPVAFAALVNALRSDPVIRAKYQTWQFYYASGTPVLANAAELRDSLAETLHALDPKDHDAATKRIVVLGHSMGGVISHTLVSSSQDRVWGSVFRVPPAQLRGDPEAIRQLVHILYFRRNPRIVRVIFMAAPHRGSPMAESFVGFIGNSLTRLPPMLERGFSQLARVNPAAMTPGAAAFYKGRFSAVRTLSPKSTALIAVSELPIEVPFHSVIGQQHQGPKERGSDGVVPYWSSHLSGAQSELVVRSGHGVIDNPDAMREVIRILHLEQRSTQNETAKNKMPNEKYKSHITHSSIRIVHRPDKSAYGCRYVLPGCSLVISLLPFPIAY